MWSYRASAQLDTILDLPIVDQVPALRQTLQRLPGEDTSATLKRFESYEDFFRKKHNEKLRRHAWYMRYEWSANYMHPYDQYGNDLLQQGIDLAKERGWQCEEAQLMINKGLLLHGQSRYSAAFEHMIGGLDILREVGIERCPEGYKGLILVGNAYHLFGDHENAIKYFREALSIPDQYLHHGDRRGAYNGMGLAFRQLHQFDSAVHYFGLTYEISKKLGEEFWMALANGNRGNAYFLDGDYDNALPLLLEDFTVSNRVGEIGSAANASLSIAAIYLQKGKPEEAEPYIHFASAHVDRTNIRALSGYYESQFLVNRLKKQYAEALLFVDSFHFARDSLLKIADVKLIDRARMTVFAEQHAREVAQLEAARSRQILVRNGLLIMMVLLGIIAFQWYKRQRLRREKELQLANLREEAAAVELINAKKELEIFTKTLKDKNELIDSFKDELDQLHTLGASQVSLRTEQISQLINSTILTEEEWKHFRELFDKVHPGFFVLLKEKMPDLTPADTRLLALTKLKLSSREMAGMLGISIDSIRKSRYRMRSRLNLSEEDDTLNQLIGETE